MAEMEWTRPVPITHEREAPELLRRFFGPFGDWEDWLTLVMLLGAVVCVSAALEGAGWSENMPPITLVSAIAGIASWLLARSGRSMLLAWPAAVLIGALVTAWQVLEMVGPGNFEQRLDIVYARYETWFHLAFSGGVSNDSLPFDSLVMALTWLGVFLFGWSVYRWHNAWIGLIPGGVALFVDLAIVGDDLGGTVLLYFLFGALLVMRTNLMSHMARWRADGASYPSLISVTFLNFGAWVILTLMAVAWIAPVGPFSTPKPILTLIEAGQSIGVNFVRLAGPLQVKKVVPVHNYTGVLPFQGSVKLGARELLSVKVHDTTIQGQIPLRGAVYDQYATGGWTAGPRQDVPLPGHLGASVQQEVLDGDLEGQVVPLTVKVERKSVVGTVLFSPGDPITSSVPFQIEVPEGSIQQWQAMLENGGIDMSDEEVLTRIVPNRRGHDGLGLSVERDNNGRVIVINVFDGDGQALPDILVAKPPDRLKEGTSYNVTGFIPKFGSDQLAEAGENYPDWVEAYYLQLPDQLPQRVRDLAYELTVSEDTPYAKAKAIEEHLRTYEVAFRVSDTPPGRDTVDYFLFDVKKGYFDYHASAMAVLLRAIGVPSRLAVGFVVDDSDFSRQDETHHVKDSNTYSWTEVYFPGYGWVAFNPSPDRPEDLAPTKGEPLVSEGESATTDLPKDLPVSADPIFGEFGLEGPGPRDTSAPESQTPYNPLITSAVVAFLAMVAGAVYLGWQRSVAGLPYSQQLWEKTVRLASWAGHAPQPGHTATEFARSLERSVGEVSGVRLLASAYNRSRFAKREPADDEQQRLREMWPLLRGDLLAAIRSRILRRGR